MNNRLPTKGFNTVIKKGKPYKSESFFVKIQKNELGFIRRGVAVSKDLAKNAVKRNYYKRLGRHILKETINNTEQGYDIVLIVKKKASKKNFKELKTEINELLSETKLKNK